MSEFVHAIVTMPQLRIPGSIPRRYSSRIEIPEMMVGLRELIADECSLLLSSGLSDMFLGGLPARVELTEDELIGVLAAIDIPSAELSWINASIDRLYYTYNQQQRGASGTIASYINRLDPIYTAFNLYTVLYRIIVDTREKLTCGN